MPTPTTANRGYKKPHESNLLQDDVLRLQDALDAIDTDMAAALAGVAGKVGKTGAETVAGTKTFSSSPLVPNATAGDNSGKAANTAYVDAALTALLGAAPAPLDTLGELAAALGNDPSFAATMAAALAAKADTTAMTAAVAAAVPAGVVLDFAGTTAPTGYLMCYGQAVNRTAYAALFAAIGVTHGAGDGATTFNLPDYRGRVAAGKDDMGGVAAGRMTSGGSGVNGATLGAVGGAETQTLTAAQIPAHSHTATTTVTAASAGTPAGTLAADGGHTHTINHSIKINGTGGNSGLSGTSGTIQSSITAVAVADHTHAFTGSALAAHGHTAATTVNNSTGGGGAHSSVQPTLIVSKIIKT